jgi:hypothetical protein
MTMLFRWTTQFCPIETFVHSVPKVRICLVLPRNTNNNTNAILPHIPMPLPSAGLPLRTTRLLELFDFQHAFAIHLTILPNQPAAQDAAEESHHQAHGCRDPHAFAVQWAFGGWEDVGALFRKVSRQRRNSDPK